jgi:hypothetical protein
MVLFLTKLTQRHDRGRPFRRMHPSNQNRRRRRSSSIAATLRQRRTAQESRPFSLPGTPGSSEPIGC